MIKIWLSQVLPLYHLTLLPWIYYNHITTVAPLFSLVTLSLNETKMSTDVYHFHLFRCVHTLQWRHNEQDSVSNHQPHNCLLSCLFRPGSNKTSKLRVTGLCAGNSPGTGEFPAQMASNAENVSIWCRHHELQTLLLRNASVNALGSVTWLICTYLIILHVLNQHPAELWAVCL